MKIRRLLPCTMATMMLIVAACLNVNGQADTTMRKGHMRDHATFTDDASFIAKNIQDNQKEIEMSQMAADRSDNSQIKALAQQMINDHTKMLQDLQKLQSSVGGAGNDMNNSGNNNTSDSGVGNNNRNNNTMSDSGAMSHPGDTGTASNQTDMTGTKTSRSADSSSSMGNMTDSSANWNNSSNGNMDTSMQNGGGMHNGDMNDQSALMNATGKEFDDMWVSHMLHAHSAKLTELRNASQSISNSQLKSIVQQAIPKVKTHKDKLQQLNGGKSGSGKSGNKSGRRSGNTSGSNTNNSSSNSGTRDSDTK